MTQEEHQAVKHETTHRDVEIILLQSSEAVKQETERMNATANFTQQSKDAVEIMERRIRLKSQLIESMGISYDG